MRTGGERASLCTSGKAQLLSTCQAYAGAMPCMTTRGQAALESKAKAVRMLNQLQAFGFRRLLLIIVIAVGYLLGSEGMCMHRVRDACWQRVPARHAHSRHHGRGSFDLERRVEPVECSRPRQVVLVLGVLR